MKKTHMRAYFFSRLMIAAVFAMTVVYFPTVAEAKGKKAAVAQPFPKTGKASWYSESDRGVAPHTANREVFDEDALTCAIWGVPFNTLVRITNLANGKSVIVRVNDRGPHKRYVRRGRVVDLTKAAFEQISSLKHGLIRIQVEVL